MARIQNVDPNYRGPTAAQLRGLASLGLDFTPIVGDVKALAYDLPVSISRGDKLGAGLSLLSALPFVPPIKTFSNVPADLTKVESAKMVAQSPNPENAAKQLTLGQGDIKTVMEAPITGSPADRGLESVRKAEGYKTFDEIRDMLGAESPSVRLGGEEASQKLISYSPQYFDEFVTNISGFGPHLGPPEQGIMRALALRAKRPIIVTGPGDIPEVVGLEKPFYMPEYVMRMENPLFMEDVGGHSNPIALLDELMENRQLTFGQQLEFGKLREDLLKNYAKKVSEMRDIVRQTESDLYVPDFQTANIPGLEKAIDTGADLPEISILDPESKSFRSNIVRPFKTPIAEISDFGAEALDISKVFKPMEGYDELSRDVESLGRKIFTEAQRAGQKVNIQDTNRIREMLMNMGFDSATYLNTGEIPTQIMLRQKGFLPDGGSSLFGQLFQPTGAESYIPFDYQRGIKLRGATKFDPKEKKIYLEKGGIVNGYEQKKLS